MTKLEVKNISASINSKQILDDISFSIEKGEVVVLMGPNGAGKSTISNVLMGNPQYELTSGKIILNGSDLSNLSPNERAKKGLFMSFQNPTEISGVTMTNFLRQSYNSIKQTNIQIGEFMKILNEKMEILGFDSKFRGRSINKGFSGGEKKRSEILQLLLFEPEYAILDEIDSGLDVDALKTVCKSIEKIKTQKKIGILIITHYNKILDYINPNKVLILKEGKIVKEGSSTLAKQTLEKGFE